MALSTSRYRRPSASEPSTSSSAVSPSYSKLDKKAERHSIEGSIGDGGLKWQFAFFSLAVLRYMSATSNIIHDCDEVFNYWEPLHYLLYKSGFQTWEYSSEFALRSYLYILLHQVVAGPASWAFGDEKVRVFYSVRLLLGIMSTISDTLLVVALSRKYGKRLASYTLALLCLTSGCFFASTSFLPSSFSMYAVSLCSALFLLEKPAMAVCVAAAGVILGWPFSILVFLPVTVCSLLGGRFKKVFLSAAATSLILFAFSMLLDCYYYGRWTSSVLNLLVYNVIGGGESHLYGTEGPLYYLKNGFNNFNFCFVLSLAFPGFFPLAKKRYGQDLLVVISPIYIWLTFMSLQPHKEERFMYPVYPLVCVAASAMIESFPDICQKIFEIYEGSPIIMMTKILRPIVLGLILCTSHSRTFSLLNGYSAPLEIYKHLEHHDDADIGSVVCVGSEWHRFPSSFFVPPYVGGVRWVDDGFRGLLPFPFNSTMGGTRAAPRYFNKKNEASDEQYLRDLDACTFFVELDLKRPHPSRSSDLSTWETVAALHYLDRELSPSMYRSFYIPYLWHKKNVFGLYKLLRKIPS